MLAKTIDRSRCDACGECIRICKSSRVIAKDTDRFPRYAFLERCIDCGHCLAICPKGAIAFTRDGGPGKEEYYAEARLIEGDDGIADPLLRTLFSVRSTRAFDARAVEREKLERVLDAMVRAPSAGNEQNRSFYIYATKPAVDVLEADTREYYRRTTAQFANPVAAKLVAEALALKDLSRTVMRNRMIADLPRKERVTAYVGLFRDLAERPNDPDFGYFRNAPAAIVVTSSTNAQEMHKAFYKSDVEIAVTYGTIAAASLGLSTCRMGLSEMAFGQDAKMRETQGIPAEERVDGILALGYSSLRWERLPPRGPVKAVWK
jgi:nitroreductase/NAD-dependent dihydropyrimidine dehydrogenase PreA subunit